MRKIKKLFSKSLAFILLLSTMPLHVFAENLAEGTIHTTRTATPFSTILTNQSHCHCSSVLGRATRYIINRDRLNPSASYSQENFKDDLREGIYDAIKYGSNYEQQLARFEINYLLNVFGKHAQMAADGVTNASLISEMNAIIARKYSQTGNWVDACTEAANYWNTIVRYLDFRKPFITESDFKDILAALGIGDVQDKSILDIEKQLKHVHEKDATENDPRPCTDCGNTVCAFHNQPPRGIVHTPYEVFPSYVIAKFVSTSEIHVTSPEIKVGVKDNIVAECTCRLGAVPIITEVNLDVQWGEPSNFIQPEGVTNIGVDVTFSDYSKDISLKADISALQAIKLSGATLMNYNLTRAVVQVKDLSGASPVIVDSSKYTFDRATLTVTFNPEDTLNPLNNLNTFYAQANSKYRVMFYIPTKMGTGIEYNSTSSNPNNNYIRTFIRNASRNQVLVPVTLVATPRIEPARWEDGILLPDIYNSAPTIVNKDITLHFIEIAGIH